MLLEPDLVFAEVIKVASPEYNRAYYALNQTRLRANCERYRATEKGLASKLRPYGITPQQYRDLLSKQTGVCAICFRATKLVIDHSHSSGKVRGLLCPTCNQGIGLLKDNPVALRSAARYLER